VVGGAARLLAQGDPSARPGGLPSPPPAHAVYKALCRGLPDNHTALDDFSGTF
jgi:hypothetical protein